MGIERVPIGWIRAGERRHLNRRTIPFPVEESIKFSIVKLSQNYCHGLTVTVPTYTYPKRNLDRGAYQGRRRLVAERRPHLALRQFSDDRTPDGYPAAFQVLEKV